MNLIKKIGILGSVGLGLAVLSTNAMAETERLIGLDRVTGNIVGQMPGVTDLLSAIAYIAGIGFGIKAALKLKEYNDTKGQQVPLSSPIMLAVVSALLIALPTFLTTGTEAVFGTGTQGTGADGTGLRDIN